MRSQDRAPSLLKQIREVRVCARGGRGNCHEQSLVGKWKPYIRERREERADEKGKSGQTYCTRYEVT